MASIVSKITTKTVCGKVDFDDLISRDNKRRELMDVFGIASKVQPGTSEYGEYLKFKGRFRAVNLESGESYESGTLILPTVAQELLGGALAGDEVGDVSFAFRIAVKYDAEAVTKYVYEMTSLMKPAEEDPLTRLGQSVGAGTLALAAPKAEAAPAADAAPAPDKKAAKK